MATIKLKIKSPNGEGVEYNYVRSINSAFYFGENIYKSVNDGEFEVDLDDPKINLQTLKQISFNASGKVLFDITEEDLKALDKKIAQLTYKNIQFC